MPERARHLAHPAYCRPGGQLMLWQVTFLILAFIVGAQYGRVRVQASEQAASTATEQLERLRDSLQAMQAPQATARRDHLAMAALQGLLAARARAAVPPA